MSDERKSREQELRESDPIHEEYEDYEDTLLSTTKIPARPGFVQRWMRTEIKGVEDQSNIFKTINRGWKPRSIDTVPKGQYVMRQDFQGVQVIGIHGMILVEIPEKLFERHQRAIDEQTQLQMAAVKNDLYKVHDPNSGLTRPELNNHSRYSRGRVAPVDD